MQATKIFQKNLESKARICVNQGGTRSGKTYGICQKYIVLAVQEPKPEVYTICRKTLPALKGSVLRDFKKILEDEGWWNDKNFNKSELIYRLGNVEIEFISVDQAEKIRGRKRKHLFINEANELTLEEYRQLALRTTEQITLDYNPSDEFHWIYDHVLTRPDCDFIQSTYLDNPFLDETTIKEIEQYKNLDPNFWRIFGLGERGISEAKVFSNWSLVDKMPEGDTIYGLDFGYNHPTALIEIVIRDEGIYLNEKLYEQHLTNDDLINRLGKIDKMIYPDPAEPQRIEELARAGYAMGQVDKGQGSVKMGIDFMKRHKLFITKSSTNLLKEIKHYSWKVDKNGVKLDEPVKINDHALDATRYAIYSYLGKPAPSIDWL